MSASNFNSSLKRVLTHEGSWSNHPADPGGVTLHGIIQRVYDADRRRRGLPTRPLTPRMAKEPEFLKERDAIYRRNYWDLVKADQLPTGVDYCVFDGAVNSGPGQSAKWLQRALKAAGLYKGSIDGVIGPGTLAATDAHPDHDALIASICDQRMAFLRALRHWKSFATGWTRRVREVKSAAQAMATGKQAPKPTPTPAEETAKAPVESTNVTATPEGEAKADTVKTAGAGGIGALLSEHIDTAAGYLERIAGLPDWVARYVIWAAIVGAFGFAAWALWKGVYGLWAQWRAKSSAEADRREEAAQVEQAVTHERRKPIPRRAVKRTRAKAKAKAA